MPVTKFQSNLNSVTSQFVARYLATLKREQGSYRDEIRNYMDMARRDPITRFCMELVFLHTYSLIGPYTHSRRRIERDIQDSINYSKGSWPVKVREMLSYIWFGLSWTEVSFQNMPNGRKWLKDLRTLNPTKYDFWGVDEQEVTIVRYYGPRKQVDLDYNTGIHLVAGTELSFDENHGSGRLEAAYPYWELHQLMMPVIAIAGQRQATPILVKKTETGADVTVIDQATGQPQLDDNGDVMTIPKGFDAIRQLSELGSAGVTAVDPDDEIYSITQEVAGDFLLNIVQLCEQYRMQACLVPTTLASTSNTGVGDAGLSQIHMQIFELMNVGVAQYLTSELIEQLFKYQIIHNFNERSEFGEFPIQPADDNALEVARIVSDSISRGSFSKRDYEAAQTLRRKLGIAELTRDEFDAMHEMDVSEMQQDQNQQQDNNADPLSSGSADDN